MKKDTCKQNTTKTNNWNHREQQQSEKKQDKRQQFGEGQFISITEEGGTHIHDKYWIVKRCVEFYKELYRSRRASADYESNGDPTMTSTIYPPYLLPSEVEI